MAVSYQERKRREQETKEAERWQIHFLAKKVKADEVVKVQENKDDGGTDGIIKWKGKLIAVEARRKGFPNYWGEVCGALSKGWDSNCIKEGIYLNERIVFDYQLRREQFIYMVEFEGGEKRIRIALINLSRIEELMASPTRWERSTNTGVRQPVKMVPVSWFKPIG